jgi:hypothetical protein
MKWKATLALAVLTTLVLSSTAVFAADNRTCKEYYDKRYRSEREAANKDWFHYDVETRYSAKLSTCIVVARRKTGNERLVSDMTNDFIRVGVSESKQGLFFCDSSGADVAKIDAIRKRNGVVDTVPYSEWLDNGEGGPPRTLKTPPKPYSSERCEDLLKKFLADL